MEKKTIQQFAAEVSRYFEKSTRTNGREFWRRTEDSPEWLQEMCHTAHGDMMPDDWKYDFIVDALFTIEECEDDDLDCPNIEADSYSSQLLDWFSSHMERVGYVNEARDNLGICDGVMAEIEQGQVMEKEEVYHAVLSFLRDKLEEMESEQNA